MPPGPVDPLDGPAFALEGHVATMDEHFTELAEGVVYVDAGTIQDVRPTNAPPPDGFDPGAPVMRTGGTIFPGLMDLHNHLSYDALPLWQVPQPFENRDQWSGGRFAETYRTIVSGPMTVLGRTPGLIEAVVRYVEAKCLLGGVTTSQGIALFSNQGVQTYYEGIVRNVERTRDTDLPQAGTRISDVAATDAKKFAAALENASCLLLHLAEGTNSAAHAHFESLQLPDQTWAIRPSLAGIHCVALTRTDFDFMAEHGASMVWSPLSNLLLYGKTADVAEAKRAGVRIGIGSDWAPSGSKNLLAELKVARAHDPGADVFSDRELVALATRNAAGILRWDPLFGSIEKGKRADLLVVAGRAGDPYARLLAARETSVALVVISGVPRYGSPSLMERFDLGGGAEPWTVAGSKRTLFLKEATANPVVGTLTLRAATATLEDALARLKELAIALEHPSPELALTLITAAQPQWLLLLDHEEPARLDQRPHLPGPDGAPTAEVALDPGLASKPLSELLGPMSLDPLTAADDGGYAGRLSKETNLPADVKAQLVAAF